MDWGYVKDQCETLVIVDAGSGYIEAFPAGNRTSQTMKMHLSQFFARFGIPRLLISDNGSELVSSDLKQWCESLGIKKMESPIYHPRANGFVERAVQTVKRAIQAWSPNLNVSFGAFLQRALMTHRNTSKTRDKTPVELLLGRKVRLLAFTDFDLHERFPFKPTKSLPTVPLPSSTIFISVKERTLHSFSRRIQTRWCLLVTAKLHGWNLTTSGLNLLTHSLR